MVEVSQSQVAALIARIEYITDSAETSKVRSHRKQHLTSGDFTDLLCVLRGHARHETERAALVAEVAALREEIEERDEWLQLVDTTPLDQFDKLGDYWVQRICIVKMSNAIASVFSKYAPERIMANFREGMRTIMHQAFVEGCIAGVRHERAALSPTEPKRVREDDEQQEDDDGR